MEGLVNDMGILEDEFKEKLDEHGNRINRLEIDSEVMKEKFSNISSQLNRIENASLTNNNALLASNNSVLSTLNKVIEGNTEKSSNKRDIIVKILGIGGSVICLALLGIFAAKGINVSIPIF